MRRGGLAVDVLGQARVDGALGGGELAQPGLADRGRVTEADGAAHGVEQFARRAGRRGAVAGEPDGEVDLGADDLAAAERAAVAGEVGGPASGVAVAGVEQRERALLVVGGRPGAGDAVDRESGAHSVGEARELREQCELAGVGEAFVADGVQAVERPGLVEAAREQQVGGREAQRRAHHAAPGGGPISSVWPAWSVTCCGRSSGWSPAWTRCRRRPR